MIVFREMSIWERIKRLSPSYRAKEDQKTKEALRWLIQHPETPCSVDGEIVPHGFGLKSRAIKS